MTWSSILYPKPTLSEKRLHHFFSGRIVIVTGASSGIGEALARQLINVGANLLLIARREEPLRKLCEEAHEAGCSAEYYAVDLRDPIALKHLCEELPQRLSQVDYFFANAGKSICRSLLESLNRAHDFDRTIDLNYRAVVHLSLALIPLLSKTQGAIIYTSSVSLLYPYAPRWSAYHASKGAADIWCQTAALELRYVGCSLGIAYMPLVDTPMSAANELYRNLPSYSADDAAQILCRLAISRRRTYIPWWARVTAPLARLCSPLVRTYYRSFP
ncbi:SDR family NAD(P)-dependent oxidoreductase [Porphyromonadaceae bacterium W3.11]|nr:SDR family NAD(P)-dependent oxidoreductase [Porphyromonadaceae bacterium W3.11]